MYLMNTMVGDRDCRVKSEEYDLDIPGGILRAHIIGSYMWTEGDFLNSGMVRVLGVFLYIMNTDYKYSVYSMNFYGRFRGIFSYFEENVLSMAESRHKDKGRIG